MAVRLFCVSLMLAVGALALRLHHAGLDLVDAGTEFERVAMVAFRPGPWRWVGLVAAAAALPAVLLSLSELLLLGGRRKPHQFGAISASGTAAVAREVSRRLALCSAQPRPDIVTSFSELIRGATAVGASDVHITPTHAGLKLTYRVDGRLHDVMTMPIECAPLMATRVKVMANLDTFVKGTAQDGRLKLTLDGTQVEARVSTLPTELGERIVLRLVSGSRSIPTLEELGLSPNIISQLRDLLSRPQGILFLTGPVGSGKTTTLYSSLKHISVERGSTTSMVTLEDPVELQLPFATQTQIKSRSGMTFAATLRSVLRQDPNVLMLGEIRDAETAEVATQAGLTGHLILTTVHGNDAAGPFARLADMDIEPFILASSTLGCLSQRLVRILCSACRRAVPPKAEQIERFSGYNIELPEAVYFEPTGCELCEGDGFVERAVIGELLLVTEAIRKAVIDRQSTKNIYQIAKQEGMQTILDDGLRRAVNGETSLAEVLKVAG